MDLVLQQGEGAMSISLKRKRRTKAELVGTFAPEPCVGCGCEPQQFTIVQVALYEGVTKGLGAIPKGIELSDEVKEKIRHFNNLARPFLDRLKEQAMAGWLPVYKGLAITNMKDFAFSPECVLGMLAIDLDWSKGRVRDLDLVEHLGMSKIELINQLIENGFLPPYFWEYGE
jgi:hypothetical protein